MRRHVFGSGLMFCLLAMFVLPLRAEAAVKGIALSPAIKELTLREGQASVGFSIQLANSTDATVEFRLSTLDFGTLDESGGIAFLGRSGQETTSYGLKEWMLLEKDTLTLAPGQSQEVKVTIENKDSLGPGGHYGAVIVSEAGQGVSESVSVLPAASTLVLLKKTGGEIQDLQLDSIKANSSFINLPRSAQLRFQNAGNVHLVPRGTVELYDPSGARVSRGVINTASSFILPESFRQYSVDMASSRQPWLPGRYRIVTTWRFDGHDETVQTVQYHWYIGKGIVFAAIMTSSVIVLYLFIRRRKRPPIRGQ